MNSHVDVEALNQLVEQGYLRSKRHPTLPLFLYNYTEKTQYERNWTPETLMCRGLIVTEAGEIVARPFPKFFNLDEWVAMGNEIPDEPFTVTEKMDGSLLIVAQYKDQLVVATRGSFESEQAIRGYEILRQLPWESLFLSECTYLFEIIFPENRIVVDYGGETKLVLLSIIRNGEGSEQWTGTGWSLFPPIEVVQGYPGYRLDQLKGLEQPNKEGFVVRFASGLRLKIKFDEYVRLHRLVTGVTTKTIWEHLRDGHSLDELYDRVPDEFYKWVENETTLLLTHFCGFRDLAQNTYEEIKDFSTRKEQALFTLSSTAASISGAVFALLDGKDPAPIIWKMLKPKNEKSFKGGVE